MKGREIKMKKDKNKIVKMATLFSAVTVSGGSIAGCGTPVKGDIYENKYNNREQQYVLASQRGGTSLKGLTGKICVSSKNRAYINNLLAQGTLYYSAGGTYSIDGEEFNISLDSSVTISNSATIISKINADKTHIYVPIDFCMEVKRAFTKTK